jgi:hypothetical protein
MDGLRRWWLPCAEDLRRHSCPAALVVAFSRIAVSRGVSTRRPAASTMPAIRVPTEEATYSTNKLSASGLY